MSRTGWVLLAIKPYRFTLAFLVIMLIMGGLIVKANLIQTPEEANASKPTPMEENVHGQGSAPALPDPIDPAHLSITTHPSQATVYLNGDSLGVTPLHGHPIAKGMHHISVRKEDYAARNMMIMLDRETYILGLPLQPYEQPTTAEESFVAVPPPTDTDHLAQARRSTAAREAPSRRPPPPEPEQVGTSASPQPRQTPARPLVGMMHVTSSPPGATVMLDDERRGQTPLTITEVPGGLHHVTLEHEGYQPTRIAVQVVPQERREVHSQLIALMGTLKILARPWGSIYIDEELHKSESSIWYTAQVPVGSHQVRVVHPQLGRWEQTVFVTANEETSVVADLGGRDDVP